MTAGHEHKALRFRSEPWRGCVTRDLCFMDGDRGAAHGFMTDVETCVCGAVRVTERGVDGAKNSLGWTEPKKVDTGDGVI